LPKKDEPNIEQGAKTLVREDDVGDDGNQGRSRK
jgi:hypothetical protein